METETKVEFEFSANCPAEVRVYSKLPKIMTQLDNMDTRVNKLYKEVRELSVQLERMDRTIANLTELIDELTDQLEYPALKYRKCGSEVKWEYTPREPLGIKHHKS